jgi:hypothetical protein
MRWRRSQNGLSAFFGERHTRFTNNVVSDLLGAQFAR